MQRVEALDGIIERLQAAERDVEARKGELDLAIRARNDLVVQAVDEGVTQRAVAAAIGHGQPHVVRILAASEPDAVLPRG